MKKPGYAKGVEARTFLKPITDCPYSAHTKFAKNWRAGWRAMNREREKKYPTHASERRANAMRSTTIEIKKPGRALKAAVKRHAALKPIVTYGHPLDPKAIDRVARRVKATISHFNATKIYVIFSRKDRKPLLGWGCFGTLGGARKKLIAIKGANPRLDRKAYAICKALIVGGSGRTW